MYLTKSIASEIIKEISPFINFDLNIMDYTGLILASTDSNRINTIHEGAKLLISKKLPNLIVETDNAYQGCKIGINLPIIFSKETVGVIGITGDPQETIKYGQIMQKMCEMLIYETFEISEKSKEDQSKLLFVNDAIHGNFNDISFKLEPKFKQMGLSNKGPFTVAILKIIYNKSLKTNPELFNAKETIIRLYIIDKLSKNHVLAISNKNTYIALTNLSPENLYKILDQISTSLQERYSVTIFATIGNDYNNYLEIPKSYQEALNLSNYFTQSMPGIYLFSKVALDFIIDQVPELYKNNLFSQIFKSCTTDETEEFSYFIKSYFECNGSLNKLASRHFIHKNTVQYKINKLIKKTDLDIRIYHDLFILYLAAQYYNSI